MTEEEFLEHLREVISRHPRTTFDLPTVDFLSVIGHLQLAIRHPARGGMETSLRMRGLVEAMIESLPDPIIRAHFMQGFNPHMDIQVDVVDGRTMDEQAAAEFIAGTAADVSFILDESLRGQALQAGARAILADREAFATILEAARSQVKPGTWMEQTLNQAAGILRRRFGVEPAAAAGGGR
jgi:hypothetical protein